MTQKIRFHDGKDRDVATEEELLAFANQIREAGGVDAIPELLPARRHESRSCLIARMVNFGSVVDTTVSLCGTNCDTNFFFDSDLLRLWWGMEIDTDRAELIAEKTGMQLANSRRYADKKVLILPKEIGNAAAAFDQGLAFNEYSET